MQDARDSFEAYSNASSILFLLLSSNDVLELEPMNSYNRLLLHRLAEIFGFSHQSVGEGDDRHLILERCPETSIPSILVSDLLWQYDDLQSPKHVEIQSRREEPFPGLKVESPTSGLSLEQREAAYFIARQRIFSVDGEARAPARQRPPKDPMVARRMIAHALGQRAKTSNHEAHHGDTENYRGHAKNQTRKYKEEGEEENLRKQSLIVNNIPTCQHLNSCDKPDIATAGGNESLHTERKIAQNINVKASTNVLSPGAQQTSSNATNDHLRKEHMGAAKRIFANALGIHPRNGSPSKGNEVKQTNKLSLG